MRGHSGAGGRLVGGPQVITEPQFERKETAHHGRA